MKQLIVVAVVAATALVAGLAMFQTSSDTPVVSAQSAPVITGSATHTRTENGGLAVGNYTAVDSGGGSIGVSGWSVQGTDRDDFSLREASTDSNGVVTISLDFRNTPNYEAPADANGNNVYEVTLRVTDGSAASTLDVAVTVTNVNEPPYFITKYSVPYMEQVTLEGYGSAGIRMDGNYGAADPEGDWITFTLSGADADQFRMTYSWRERNQRHIHLVLDSSTNLDYEQPADANEDGVYEVTIRAANAAGFVELDVTLTVLDVNELHTLAGPSGVSFPTGGTGTVATYTVTDPDGAAIPLTLGGTDAASFALNSGALTFKSAPDYRTKSAYEVTVTASDETHTVSRDVTVTVVNSQQTLTVSGAGSYSIPENATSLWLGTYTATASGGGTVAWSVEGTDAAAFSISADGGLRLNSWPNYEAKSSYAAKVRAASGTVSATMNVAVTVTDVNEPPQVVGPSEVSFPSGGTGVVATFSARDPDAGESAYLYWYSSYSNGTDNESFNFNTYTGELTFKSPPDYNTRSSYTVVITAEQTSPSHYEVSRRITVTISPPGLTLTGSREVSIEENATDLSLGSYTVSNAGGETVTWSLEGTDKDMFTISAGALSLKAAPDYETRRSYAVTVKAAAGDDSATVAVAVNVNDVDEAPTITGGPTSPSYAENGAGAVGTYTATDPESDTIYWSVQGDDASAFSIGGSDGVLTFVTSPDYETKTSYSVTVKAAAGGKYATRAAAVSITNVDEAPTITGGPTAPSYAENGSGAVGTYTATDPENAAITWSVEGTDASAFNISSSGELTFVSSPDYETKTSYSVSVKATAGGKYATRAVAVSITNVDDTSVPGRVTVITATATAHDTVSLSWEAPAGGATVTGYKILRRAVNSEKEFQALSQDTGNTNTTWTDRGLNPRTKYAYRVQALGSYGTGPLSTLASVITPAAPAPGQVTGLTATANNGAVSLSWTAPSDGGTVSGYRILRRHLGVENQLKVLVENTGDTGAAYSDTSVAAGARYAYRVKALGPGGEGEVSAPATAAVPN